MTVPARGDPPTARGDFLLLHCITSHAVIPLAIFSDYGLLGCFFGSCRPAIAVVALERPQNMVAVSHSLRF